MDEKNLEIITGNGEDLEISEVHDHLNPAKPKTENEKPKNIIIPVEKNDTSKEKNEENETFENQKVDN